MRFSKLLLLLAFVYTGHLPAAHAASGTLDIKPGQLLMPHKALYDIEMVSKRSSSQILNISGQMFYEWKPNCDAWMTDHRFNLFYEYADSPAVRITSDFTTYETFDGKSFDYTSRRKRNGAIYEEVRGRAAFDNPDGIGEALYSLPEGLEFDMKKGTLFPMAHSLEVLKTAQKGKKFYSATIFDGSDDEGPVEVSAFIGKPVNALARVSTSPEIDESLLNTKAWAVRMAFFPLIEPSEDAEYEMDVVFHDNGIISDMLVEYRDFSVSQKLSALEKLEAEDCKKVNKNNEKD